MHFTRRNCRDLRITRRAGAAAVETALVLPLFFGVVMGMVEFGRAFMVTQLLTNAAREGARVAITAGSTNDEVTELVKTLVNDTVGVGKSRVKVSIRVSGSNLKSLASAEKREMCEVRVNVAVGDVSLLPAKYLTNATLKGQAAMRHE